MRLLHRSGVCALALVAGAAALQFEPAVFGNLAFEQGRNRVTVEAVRVPLWSAALAQSADTFALDNVEFVFGPITFQAKRIEFSGVSPSRAEIAALFSKGAGGPVADRLARINAKQIVIPELRTTQTIGSETTTTTYRNILLKDVVQGRAGLLTTEAMAAETKADKTTVILGTGLTSVSELDLPALVRLYEQKAQTDSGPMTKIHGAFSLDSLTMADEQGGVSLRIARISGRDFMARTVKDTWMGPVALITELGAKDNLTAEEESKVLRAAADILSAFDIGLVEATGFEMKEASNGMTAKIARMAYTASSGGQPSDARLEGLEAIDKDGRVSVQTMSLTGFSIGPTLERLRTIEGKSLDDLDAATARGLLPTLGTFRMSGVAIDIKDPHGPDRVKATFKDFEFTADKPLNGLPTHMRVGLQNLVMDLPEGSQEDGIKDLLALGYGTLDLSFLFATRWNEATNELSLSEVSVQGKDMGSIALTGILGNVTRDVFDADETVAMTALMGAKAISLDMQVENSGLFERYLDQAAKEEKTTPDELRKGYGMAAAVVIPSLVGNSEQGKALSQAVTRFIAKPGRILINARAKEPGGLGMVDLMTLSEPAQALEKLDITAKAE